MPTLLQILRRTMLVPVCALAVATACESPIDLTETPQTFVDPANYFRNAGEAINATNGIYGPLMTWDNWISPAEQEVTCEGVDLSCPNWWAWGTSGPGSGYWFASRSWTANFAVVRRANDVLAQLNKSTLDPVLVSRLKGEAHFLRGYAYFELVRRYGEVPLRLTAYVPDGTYGEIARSPIPEVYKAIVTDMKAAASELPANFSSKTFTAADRGRPIAASANGLLAKAYLTMAGKEANMGAVYYDSARKAAQLVMNDGNVKLETDFMKNFDWQTQITSAENLWQIGATHQENTGPEVGGFFNPQDYSTYGGGGSGNIMLRTSFYETYEPGDLRVKPGYAVYGEWFQGRDATHPGIQTYLKFAVPDSITTQIPAASQNGWTYTDGGSCDTNGVNFYKLASGRTIGITPRVFTTKYQERVALTKSQNSTNPVILRYADVLLVFAEAENEASGSPSAAAYAAINQVRSRALLPDLQTFKPGLNQAGFRDAVWLERRHELAGEFQEIFDTKRQGRWLDMVNNVVASFPGARVPNAPTCKKRQGYQALFPLPDAEIGANRLIKQNPGY